MSEQELICQEYERLRRRQRELRSAIRHAVELGVELWVVEMEKELVDRRIAALKSELAEIDCRIADLKDFWL